MRRADRLFQIIQILRLRRVTTAAYLAAELELSERTIYRDIRDLILSGVPIEGEAGVGYALRRGFDLPPLMFTEDEIEALVFGARTVGEWSDPELKKAARNALGKIETVLPPRLRERLKDSVLFSHNFQPSSVTAANLPRLRAAVRGQRKLRIAYTRLDGEATERVVRPLCLTFFGHDWLLSGWCELREAFRNFRVDRVTEIELLGAFADEPGKALRDFMGEIARRDGRGDD